MKIVIVYYIRFIIKMPGIVKSVGIYGYNQKKQQRKRNPYIAFFGRTAFTQISHLIIVRLYFCKEGVFNLHHPQYRKRGKDTPLFKHFLNKHFIRKSFIPQLILCKHQELQQSRILVGYGPELSEPDSLSGIY